MPQIKQFDTPALALRPTETGIETVAGNARREGAFYSQEAGALEGLGSAEGNALRSAGRAVGSGIQAAGDAYVNYLDHEQISAGAAKGTALMAQKVDEWNKIASDPKIDVNDPTVKAKFMAENLEPALQQFKDDSGYFTTEKSQQYAEQLVEHFRQHMDTKASADMSKLAEIKTKVNAQTTLNSLSSMANGDPSSVKFALDAWEHTIGAKVDSSPTMDAVTKAQVHGELGLKGRMDIVKSAALGDIMKSGNPEAAADKWIKQYPDLINSSEAKMLAGYGRQQIHARNYDYEMNRRREKEVAQDKSNEATNQYLIDVRSKDPRIANDPTAVKILNDQTLTKQDKNNLLNYVDRTLKPETDSRLSQQTFVGLLRQLRDPNADTDKVMQDAWNARLMDPGKPGSMTEHDFDQFRNEVVARKTPEGAALERDRNLFFKQYGGTIASEKDATYNPTGRIYDPQQGSPKLYAAEMEARRMEGVLKQKGLDPHLVYDPASEYYIGNPKRLMKFQGSMQGDLSDRASAPAKSEVPFDLRGIASLSHNKRTGQYRDDTTGKVYNPDGSAVK